jgi:hypothetical protein
MSQRNVRLDDRSGQLSSEANPIGWLNVVVTPIGGAPQEVDFSSWQNFREWVELSDPSCGQVLTPPPPPPPDPPVATGP